MPCWILLYYVLISIGEMAGTISKLWSATGCEDFASFICIKMVAIKAMDLKNVNRVRKEKKDTYIDTK